jgi:glyoxylase-like metal-dependent hydrolase (beta-lactamase superfamily II)
LPLEVSTLTVGPLDTNCYIIWDRNTRACAIIDPGGDCDRVASVAASLDLSVEWILLTHGHFDHTFCAGDLAARFGAGVGLHEADAAILGQSFGVAEMFYDFSENVPVTPTGLLTAGRSIPLGESEVKVVHTPGHSEGGLSFVTDAGVFCGDAIFAGSIGRTDFPGGSFDQLIQSIRTGLLVMDDSTPLFPGHGPATTVGQERQTNPYLQGLGSDE